MSNGMYYWISLVGSSQNHIAQYEDGRFVGQDGNHRYVIYADFVNEVRGPITPDLLPIISSKQGAGHD